MSVPLAITGRGVVSAAGIGVERLFAGVPDAGAEGGPWPPGGVRRYTDFDPRKILGRKGTTFLDRSAALALVASAQALEDGGHAVSDDTRHRIGVVLGTTNGSVKSMSDYTAETLVEDRPYMVTPALFPTTVINFAAGQIAIRHGLRGVNATVAGGPVAFLHALDYARDVLASRRADLMLTGAVEALTPHDAWADQLAGRAGPTSEGAALFTLERSDDARRDGRRVRGEVCAVSSVYVPRGASTSPAAAMNATIERLLGEAGVARAEVAFVVANDDTAVAPNAERIRLPSDLGDTRAATAGLLLAVLLARHDQDPAYDGRPSLLLASSGYGDVAGAVVRGWRHLGADRR